MLPRQGPLTGATSKVHRLRTVQTHKTCREARIVEMFSVLQHCAFCRARCRVKAPPGTHCGHAVLPGTSLCHDTLLAQAPTQQGLPQGVVDFVGPRVVEVLALQVDLRPAAIFPASMQGTHVRAVQEPTTGHCCTCSAGARGMVLPTLWCMLVSKVLSRDLA